MTKVILLFGIVVPFAPSNDTKEVGFNLAPLLVSFTVFCFDFLDFLYGVDCVFFLCFVSVLFTCNRNLQMAHALMIAHELRLYLHPRGVRTASNAISLHPTG